MVPAGTEDRYKTLVWCRSAEVLQTTRQLKFCENEFLFPFEAAHRRLNSTERWWLFKSQTLTHPDPWTPRVTHFLPLSFGISNVKNGENNNRYCSHRCDRSVMLISEQEPLLHARPETAIAAFKESPEIAPECYKVPHYVFGAMLSFAIYVWLFLSLRLFDTQKESVQCQMFSSHHRRLYSRHQALPRNHCEHEPWGK
jgi:hypothetical protein